MIKMKVKLSVSTGIVQNAVDQWDLCTGRVFPYTVVSFPSPSHHRHHGSLIAQALTTSRSMAMPVSDCSVLLLTAALMCQGPGLLFFSVLYKTKGIRSRVCTGVKGSYAAFEWIPNLTALDSCGQPYREEQSLHFGWKK
jgi:hypothetical protein